MFILSVILTHFSKALHFIILDFTNSLLTFDQKRNIRVFSLKAILLYTHRCANIFFIHFLFLPNASAKTFRFFGRLLSRFQLSLPPFFFIFFFGLLYATGCRMTRNNIIFINTYFVVKKFFPIFFFTIPFASKLLFTRVD